MGKATKVNIRTGAVKAASPDMPVNEYVSRVLEDNVR